MTRARTVCATAHILSWPLPEGGEITLQLHRILSGVAWRQSGLYQDGTWHVVTDGTGGVLLARLCQTPGGSPDRG